MFDTVVWVPGGSSRTEPEVRYDRRRTSNPADSPAAAPNGTDAAGADSMPETRTEDPVEHVGLQLLDASP